MKCKECGKEFIDEAEFCPFCGKKVVEEFPVDIESNSTEKAIFTQTNWNQKKMSKKVIILLICTLGIIVISIGTLFTYKCIREIKAKQITNEVISVFEEKGLNPGIKAIENLKDDDFFLARKQISVYCNEYVVAQLNSSKSTREEITQMRWLFEILLINEEDEYIETYQKLRKLEAQQEYKETLTLVILDMIDGASIAEECCGLIHDVWYNTIYKKSSTSTNKYTQYSYGGYHSDFNDSLKLLFNDEKFTSKIDDIEKNQADVANLMKSLNNPPEEYNSVYRALLDLYDVYLTLTNAAVNPSGTLQTFTSNFNNADSDFLKCYKTVEIYL